MSGKPGVSYCKLCSHIAILVFILLQKIQLQEREAFQFKPQSSLWYVACYSPCLHTAVAHTTNDSASFVLRPGSKVRIAGLKPQDFQEDIITPTMEKPGMPRTASSESATLPQLTHQPSFESERSPITPGYEVANPFVEPRIATRDHDVYHMNTAKEPKNALPTTVTLKEQREPPPYSHSTQMPTKDLAFLGHDPYARDDVIPFDKSKPVSRSRSGSVKSMLSMSSMKSVKRGFGSMKRRLSRRGSTRPKMERRPETSSEAPKAAAFQPPPPSYQGTCTQRLGSTKGPTKGPHRADEEEYNVDYVCW